MSSEKYPHAEKVENTSSSPKKRYFAEDAPELSSEEESYLDSVTKKYGFTSKARMDFRKVLLDVRNGEVDLAKRRLKEIFKNEHAVFTEAGKPFVESEVGQRFAGSKRETSKQFMDFIQNPPRYTAKEVNSMIAVMQRALYEKVETKEATPASSVTVKYPRASTKKVTHDDATIPAMEKKTLAPTKSQAKLAEMLKAGAFEKIDVHGGVWKHADTISVGDEFLANTGEENLEQYDGITVDPSGADLDTQSAAYLFSIAEEEGMLPTGAIKQIDIIAKGEKTDEGIGLDHGGVLGIQFSNNDKKVSLDHHQPWKAPHTSATKQVFNLFEKTGIFTEEVFNKHPYLKDLKNFVTIVDNFEHVTPPRGEKAFSFEDITQKYPNSLGAVYSHLPFGTVLKFIKEGKKPWTQFTEADLKQKISGKFAQEEDPENPGKYRFQKDEHGKLIPVTLKDIVEKTRVNVFNGLEKLKKRQQENDTAGIAQTTPEMGKVFFDVTREDGKGHVVLSNELSRMSGYDTFFQWNEQTQSFFVSSKKDLKGVFNKIKESTPGAKLVRGEMIVMPVGKDAERGKITTSRNDFLEKAGLIDWRVRAKGAVEALVKAKEKVPVPLSKEQKEAVESAKVLRSELDGVLADFKKLKEDGLLTQEKKGEIEKKLLAIKEKQEKSSAVLEKLVKKEEKITPEPKSVVEVLQDPEVSFSRLETTSQERFWENFGEEDVVRYVDKKIHEESYEPKDIDRAELLHMIREASFQAKDLIKNRDAARKRIDAIENKEKRDQRYKESNANLEKALVALGRELYVDVKKFIDTHK